MIPRQAPKDKDPRKRTDSRSTGRFPGSELLKKVRRIEITSSRMVSDLFAGQYHSVFKGRGIEFDEVREYQIGDDIRTIDWNVTARTGRAHVKKFIEERELTVMLLVDASRSGRFASVNEMKNKLAAEIAAVLAFSAIRNNDKVGLIIFTDQIEKFIPPRKGTQNVLRVIREVLFFQPERRQTDIPKAVEYLTKVTRRHTVSFLISDFMIQDIVRPHQPDEVVPLQKVLAIANKRHDLIAVTLNDPKEVELPDAGLLMLEDAETGKAGLVDSTSPLVRDQYRARAIARQQTRQRLFRRVGMDYVDVWTDKPYSNELVKFFARRRKRMM